MSKAFTRENDDAPEPGIIRRLQPKLPAGARNHVTPDGARRWRLDLERLIEVERPRLAAAEDEEANRRRAEIDQEIHRLGQFLRSAVVTPPPLSGDDRIRFGALVTVRDSGGAESCYRIVGVEEADPERGWISWISPLARALLNLRAGEFARLRTSAGEDRLEIRTVVYWREAQSAPAHRQSLGK